MALTERQRQVAEAFCAGKTYTQVAAELGLSPGTINPHLKAAARNLGIATFSRAALRIALAREDIL